MSTITLPPACVYIIAALLLIFTGYFQSKDLPRAKLVNAIIAAIFFITATTVCYYFIGPISRDPSIDIPTYIGILGVVYKLTPCKQLADALLEIVPSPLLLFLKGKLSEIETKDEIHSPPKDG